LLGHYGFDLAAVQRDPCESVAAAGWVLRYIVEMQQVERIARHPILPERAKVWQPMIAAYSRAANIDPNLVNAVILQESRFHPHARSPADAYGLMQLTGPTARSLGVDRYNAQQNLWGGIWYLSILHKTYGGNLALTLAAYNAGPTAVAKYHGVPPYQETRNYVPSVLRYYSSLTRVAQAADSSAAPIVDRN
jgi:soluble lytic murein transglycosylase-like protein